jgi:hypothetical protein
MGAPLEGFGMKLAFILADGIDFPLLIVYGAIVLVPLMLFQVGVEGAILRRVWGIPFKQLARIVFVANCWSLIAGIPAKILNAWLYDAVLPNDLLGFFKYYPFAAVAGTFVYFVITVFVEGFYLSRRVKEVKMPISKFWAGVVVANAATYAVLGPLNYFGTRPDHRVKQFTANTSWAAKPPTQIVYFDSESGHQKRIFSDGSGQRTIVPSEITNYIVTSNLETIQVTNSLTSEHPREANWQSSDEFGELRAWAEPGLGNSLYIYRTNDNRRSSIRVAVNPGLLHLPNSRFDFMHPVFISNGRECLFECGEFIYLLDIDNRRVGKLAHGTNFTLFGEGRIR